MNYWFLYRLDDGSIYGAPYRGDADEWTNVPEGCGVIGPLSDEVAVDAFENPECYVVSNGVLTAKENIEELKAAKEQERQRQNAQPSVEERMQATEDVLTSLMGI